MKNIKDYLIESLNGNKEKTVDSEEKFRQYAENKFKEVFGDSLDEKRMHSVIDGILKNPDNQKYIDDENWGTLVGILNKSFGS